jgi:hypothetical protein
MAFDEKHTALHNLAGHIADKILQAFDLGTE